MELYNKIRKNIVLYQMQIEAVTDIMFKRKNLEIEKNNIKQFVIENYTIIEELEYYKFISDFTTDLTKDINSNKGKSDIDSEFIEDNFKNLKIESKDLLKLFGTKSLSKKEENIIKKLELNK